MASKLELRQNTVGGAEEEPEAIALAV